MDAHRYWRLYVTANYTSGSAVALAGLEIRGSLGGENIATAGNGTASSTAIFSSYLASQAFDGDSQTLWASTVTSGGWLAWDFGAGNEQEVAQIALVQDDGASNITNTAFFKSGRFEYSDNGSTWTSKITLTDVPQAFGTYIYDVPIAISGSTAASLPPITAIAYGGAAIDAHLPRLSLASNAGALSTISLPSLTAYALGHDSTGEQAAAITLPSLAATARGGASARISLPSFASQAAGTVTAAASANITLPSLNATANATASEVGSANIALPSMGSKSYAGALCSVTIGSITSQATGTTGGSGRATITLPLFQAAAVGTEGNHGYANIVLPSLSLHSGGNGAAISLPSLTLTAIGTAVITATYEAYAINLNHIPVRGVDPVDEVTRYTNFPFTHVVRYKNSYYGANSTGLYLLEGTTDNGTPIPWAFETAITDFKSPNKKTLAAAYFSGRFGTSSTIQLKKGEKSPITHAFTTPRGTLAQNHRQVFGKDRAETRTRYFALAASGTSEFELDAIECDVHNTTRRI